MGMATILGARSIVLIATGPRKTKAITAMLRDSITTVLPASLLHLRHDVTVLLDEDAARGATPFIK
jgi:glucosamine-6-phosphate deaminase